MPVSVVRTPEDEIAWERASAREEYPDATGERFYRIVAAIYRRWLTTNHAGSARPRGQFDEQGVVRSVNRRGPRSDKVPRSRKRKVQSWTQ